MATRIAINGFGRIGRTVTRVALDRPDIDIVAVNDLTDPELLANLLRYDSVHGRLAEPVAVRDGSLVIGGRTVPVLSEKNPADLPWADLGVDVVVESTGAFTDGKAAAAHLEAGAGRVLISAPATNTDFTVVYGINDGALDASHRIVSNASCTTNCAAPLAQVLHQEFGVRRGLMNTSHAYTSDQRLHDSPHRDFRRARAAAGNIIPTTTGAARAIGVVLPELAGLMDGLSMRVPVVDGSIVDLTVELHRSVTVDEVNAAFAQAAQGSLKDVLVYSEDPLVSTDIIGTAASCTFDAPLTMVVDDGTAGSLVKVVGWYDNEAGFSHRTVDVVRLLGALD
ncbi:MULTISPECIES: type I glyceraldehyde-3-phosphate dehydrogenase [Streptomyces]|uniref:Glyceraldehyde-3-phosphate dehydrogenase n=1 Tax=Streptomyces cacaoi TaxID=1898 RepID=A0A4Y3R0P9_STRCI|nr:MULTISPECIES: type I glyceraldehyde-3-phosphate dehydrogenase [Streptomyces]NNG88389.1 type I glyceraldehyde-3-phosphate dehydrogenase [Streptomyces cacaoi]QHF94610.1 type I glyceraldehyde-3-phosphate dehydrogenase [Streptomyces sp. NHF165]GEB49700.1 glyceraldehyde-3-phosphate dehydrogenase [Streptomyces cacaoi]